MKICYVMAKWDSIYNQRILDKFKENDIDFCTARAGTITSTIDSLRIRRMIRKEKVDILHGGWVMSAGFSSALAKSKTPFVLMPWGSDILIHPFENYIYKKIIQYTINKADKILCDAEFVKKTIIDLTNYPEEDIVVFPLGIDLKMFNSKVKSNIREKLGWEDKKIIIMNRYFKPIYDHITFIHSLSKIITQHKNIGVILIGDGETLQNIKKRVSEKGLSKYVYFAGHVPNKEIAQYLVASDIYVSSSLSDGTAGSLLEAMACGLPCVMTDVPSNREWIQHDYNGYIVKKKDSKDIAEKVITLLQDENKMKLFGRRNIEIARIRSDWNKNFDKMLEVYKEMMK